MTSTACCDVPSCVSLRAPGALVCTIHRDYRKVVSVSEGATCTKCHKPVRVGQWVTAASRPGEYRHTKCPVQRKGKGE